MGFYGSKITVPGMRPWSFLEISDHPECWQCTWVWAPDITNRRRNGFALKYVNRACPMHGRKLPAGYI